MQERERLRELDGRIAVVSGSESGIGAACAKALGAAGAAVASLFHRDAAAAEKTVTTIRSAGGKALSVPADVCSEGAVDAAFDAVHSALGVPDILVNAAGLNQSGVAVADMSLGQWDRLLQTDLTGPFLTCRRFVRDLLAAQRPGKIINISSIHAKVVRAGAADYDSAKGGLRNLTATLALEAAPWRINVNAIAPGMILTAMNERALVDEPYRHSLEASIPWGRAGTAHEVAKVAVFLASEAADYITGGTITIDGGLSLVLGQKA